MTITWDLAEWTSRRDAYLARVSPWAKDRVARMSRLDRHPVYDFLFEYYSFRPAHLLRWTPGYDIALTGASGKELGWTEFVTSGDTCILPATAFPQHRLAYLKWADEYLTATLNREPAFGCMGLHEWAMVYRDPNVRHSAVPLRLGMAGTDAVVEAQQLRCTHYDAFRFFTPDAVPRNRISLDRPSTTQHDQPGCVHVNMDLYRFAIKIAPFCPSEVAADAFELAIAARELDMRASPYDLTRYGFQPIPIETREGREEYVLEQREIYRRGMPSRVALLEVYRRLLERNAGRSASPVSTSPSGG